MRRLLTAAILVAALAPPARARAPQIAFEKYELPNGLDVILHVDDTTPLVHVEVWYAVGARDDPPGRKGMAHLFEHLMFDGTKHFGPEAFLRQLAAVGATNRNGRTTADVTSYHESLPAHRLELALWLESSRMGFLVDRPGFAASLERQRAVVKHEWNGREARPLGTVDGVRLAALYPAGHPYAHEVIGDVQGVEAIDEDDARRFYFQQYAPNNAALVVAGDIDVARTKALVERYFAPLRPARRPRREIPPPAEAREQRITMQAGVGTSTGILTWLSPGLFQPGDAELDLLARVLAGGKGARLIRRLVHERGLAQVVTAEQTSLEHGGQFEISFTPRPGRDSAEIQAAIDEELATLAKTPVAAAELDRAKNQLRTELYRGLETLQGRAARLLLYNQFAGDPGALGRDLDRYHRVDATALQGAVARFLRRDARVVVTVEPDPRAPVSGRRAAR